MHFTSHRDLTILLKQNPTLTAGKAIFCTNDNVGVRITNLETNPYSLGGEGYQYYINGFEYENGKPFEGI
jgi:hypothetical protein